MHVVGLPETPISWRCLTSITSASKKLAALYPMKSPQDLMRDLISAALDEMETSFPYVQGTKVVAYDEDGFEIYEDQGLTPKFVSLSQKHIQRLKARQLESVA